MPSTVTVDMSATFAQLMLMSVAVKTQYGSDVPDIAKTGEKKYVCEVAATPLPDGPIAPKSEILAITITGGDEQAMLSIPPGTPVTLERLRMGISPIERTEKGVRGGRPWFQGVGLRRSAGMNRPPVGDQKAA